VRCSDFAKRIVEDGKLAERARELYWRDYKRKHGPAAGIRIAEQLRCQVIAQRPSWPSPRDRAEDHAAHQRALDALARVGARSG
jgi:hypothetical protein